MGGDIHSTHAVEFQLKYLCSNHNITVVASVVDDIPAVSIRSKYVPAFRNLQLADPVLVLRSLALMVLANLLETKEIVGPKSS